MISFVDSGYLERILLSHDTAACGGVAERDFTAIPSVFRRLLTTNGLSDRAWTTLASGNVRALFSS